MCPVILLTFNISFFHLSSFLLSTAFDGWRCKVVSGGIKLNWIDIFLVCVSILWYLDYRSSWVSWLEFKSNWVGVTMKVLIFFCLGLHPALARGLKVSPILNMLSLRIDTSSIKWWVFVCLSFEKYFSFTTVLADPSLIGKKIILIQPPPDKDEDKSVTKLRDTLKLALEEVRKGAE